MGKNYFKEDSLIGFNDSRTVSDVYRNPRTETERKEAMKLMKEGRSSELFKSSREISLREEEDENKLSNDREISSEYYY